MYTLEDDYETDTKPKTSTQRIPKGGYRGERERQEAQRIIDNMPVTQRSPRASRHSEEAQGDVYYGPQRQRGGDVAENTWSNEQIRAARSRTTTTQRTYAPPSKLTKQPSKRQKQPKHPAVYVSGTIAAIVGFVILSTSGAAWWSTTFHDPGTYGPTHGTIATGVLGGGDSKEHPTKIIGLNNGGKIELIILHANDPAHTQIINGPDLTTIDFPDPMNAEVDVQTGDYNGDGKQDVKVTIYATTFDMPFHRYNRPSVLDGDGKGGLKLQQPAGGQ